MRWQARIAQGLLLVCVVMFTAGCQSMYLKNRYYDFRDTVALGAGITTENPVTGMWPPSLGLYFEATDYLQLGWITHNGYTAETDLRGTFVGPESMTRAGFIWWQYLQKNQDYERASYINPFKDKDFIWCTRMESYLLSHHNRPAKRLHYEHWAPYPQEGFRLLHRGWQYWGYVGTQVAISDPFLTHAGFMLKFGIDFSEISDFLLGWFGKDFKHDDMLRAEYDEFMRMTGGKGTQASQPVAPMVQTPAAPEGALAPPSGDATAERPLDIQAYPEMKIIYFDYDKSDIRADQLPRIEENLQVLKANPDVQVQIIGNTDERGTTEYNYNLGVRRATSVRDYLTKNGIAAERIMIQSRGEESPADPGHDEAAWAKNRRAEFNRVMVIETSPNP